MEVDKLWEVYNLLLKFIFTAWNIMITTCQEHSHPLLPSFFTPAKGRSKTNFRGGEGLYLHKNWIQSLTIAGKMTNFSVSGDFVPKTSALLCPWRLHDGEKRWRLCCPKIFSILILRLIVRTMCSISTRICKTIISLIINSPFIRRKYVSCHLNDIINNR